MDATEEAIKSEQDWIHQQESLNNIERSEDYDE